jgi:hypothetical protein
VARSGDSQPLAALSFGTYPREGNYVSPCKVFEKGVRGGAFFKRLLPASCSSLVPSRFPRHSLAMALRVSRRPKAPVSR